MRTAEPGLLRSSWFLKGGHWTKVEDHVDPSDKNTRRIIPEDIKRGVFQFHTRHVALAAGSRQVTSSVPFSDGLLSRERAISRGYGSSAVGRFDLPPSVVDQLDALQHVAVGGSGWGAIWWIWGPFFGIMSCSSALWMTLLRPSMLSTHLGVT